MQQKLSATYKGKKVLITGHTGFKGSWLSICLLEMGADVYGYALEPYTLNDNFVQCGLDKKMHHKIGDVRNKALLESYINQIKPEIVFHLAAQPLVLESYKNPVDTFDTNVMGTVNIMDIIRKTDFVKAFVNVTSDKCYDNKEWVWGYRENDAMGGKDPYSASKGAAELVFNAFHQSYFKASHICVASVRAGNVIGGGDWADNRIVPDFFRAYYNKNILEIRNPQATRPWQFVLEPLSGYLILGSKLLTNEGKKFEGGWNFGPKTDTHKTVFELIQEIKQNTVLQNVEVNFVNAALHEAHLLKLDISKATTYLEWKPLLDFKQTLKFVVEGYQKTFDSSVNVYELRKQQINNYFEKYNSIE